MPWSTGSWQSPEQSPEGHNCAPRREQLPKQLLPSPQVASSIVLFGWQQWTVTDSLEKVKMFSKKLIALSFPVIHIISSCFPISLRLWNTFHFVHMCRKIPPDILEGKESVSASTSPVWNMTDCGRYRRRLTTINSKVISSYQVSNQDRNCGNGNIFVFTLT